MPTLKSLYSHKITPDITYRMTQVIICSLFYYYKHQRPRKWLICIYYITGASDDSPSPQLPFYNIPIKNSIIDYVTNLTTLTGASDDSLSPQRVHHSTQTYLLIIDVVHFILVNVLGKGLWKIFPLHKLRSVKIFSGVKFF